MFRDHIVVITGAASGIGLGTAKAFISQGAGVIAADMDEAGLKKAQAELGKSYAPYVCNVSKADDIEKVAKDVEKNHGRIDVLVNNAGAGKMGLTPENMQESDFYYHFDVLVKGPMLVVKYFIPLLRKSPRPSMVNIASVAALIEVNGHSLYSSAKAAVEKLTKCWVRDFPGIRINTILPGWIDTPIYVKESGFTESQIKEFLYDPAIQTIPCRRIGRPEDIANCILFLSSPKASYIDGASIAIDGGLQCNANWGF